MVWFGVAQSAASCLVWGAVAFRLLSTLPSDGPPFSEQWREFLGFSSTVAVNRIWTQVQDPTSKVVVGAARSVAQVAFFQVPSMITTRITGLLHTMSKVLLPTSSQLVAAGEHGLLVALYERASRLFYLLNVSLTGAVVVFAGPLLTHWVGPQYGENGGLAFVLLTMAAGLNATSMAAGSFNLALGRPRVNLAFSLINSFINLATVYFFTVWWGIAGTAASALLAQRCRAVLPPLQSPQGHRREQLGRLPHVLRAPHRRDGLVAAVSWLVLRPLASSLLVTVGLVAVTAAAGLLVSAAFGAFTSADWASLRSTLRAPGTPPPNVPTSAAMRPMTRGRHPSDDPSDRVRCSLLVRCRRSQWCPSAPDSARRVPVCQC